MFADQAALTQSAAPATTAETTLVTADANFRNDLSGLVISQSAAGTVTIRNKTGGSAVLSVVFAAAGIQQFQFYPPLAGFSQNNNWTVQNTAGTTTITACYVKGS